MSWFKLTAISSTASSLRSADGPASRQTSDQPDTGPGFDATLTAVRQKNAAGSSASPPPAPPKKLDKSPSKNSDTSSQAGDGKPADQRAPDAQASSAATDSDTAPAKPGAGEKKNAATTDNPTDTTGVVMAALAAAAPAPAPVAPATNAAGKSKADIADGKAAAEQVPQPQAAGQAAATQAEGAKEAAAKAVAGSGGGVAGADQAVAPATEDPQAAPGLSENQGKKTRVAHLSSESSSAAEGPSAQAAVADVAVAPVDATAAALLTAATAAAAPSVEKEAPTAKADAALAGLGTGAPTNAPEKVQAESAPAAQESHAADPADTFDQVVMGLKGKFDARSGKADIRLDPPNLGTVHVSVSLENGSLTAEFQSASNVVRDLLKGNLDKLKTALQSQGVAVDRLAVDAPPSAGATPGQNSSASFGSATHDGRSAGQQDGRSGQQRSGGGGGDGFARMFTQAQEAPLDLVA